MKKLITAFLLIISLQSFSQSKVDSVALWNKHIDSVLNHTSVVQFNQWVEDNVSVSQYKQAKFQDLYNAFVQWNYNTWIAKKSSPKK